MSLMKPRKKYLWVWFLWLGLFYACWAIVVSKDLNVALARWPMALAMTVGSYAAGSTPMGGGTVGFPVLVLFFDEPASLGRDFSFAVQSIGMTSASIFILARRQPLAGAVLEGAILGSLIGLPFGIFLVAPLIADLWIKLFFAVLWGSFGLLHLYRIDEIASREGMTEFDERWDQRVGIAIGLFASALLVSVTGVGIDMVLYAALVLLCRADLKIAIPTSVVIMAFNSALGVFLKAATHGFQPGVYENWLAAAPVVALGAPLGAFIVDYIGRKPTLLVVAVLCIGQLAWTLHAERDVLGVAGFAGAFVAVLSFLLVFEVLRRCGAKLVDQNLQRIAWRKRSRSPVEVEGVP